MDPILYTVVDGGTNDLARQDVIANNLANINTPGFKADLYEAQVYYLNGPDGTPIADGNGKTYVVQMPNGIDITPGEIMTTGKPLDVAVNGNGFMVVQNADGTEGYTRGGALRIDATGQLLTPSGRVVLGDGGPITIPPSRSIEIASDGTISIIPADGDLRSLAVVDRIRIVTLDSVGLTRTADGLVSLGTNGTILETDPNVGIVSGALEGSNVSPVEQLVDMISANRDFEAQMKIMTVVNEDSDKLAQVLQLSQYK